MKIKLLVSLPVDSRHGAVKDAEFDFINRGGGKVWFTGADGEKLAAFRGEYVFVADESN